MFAWLHTLLFADVTNRKLGRVLGSRTAVKITANDGRLPDILFMRAENEHIIHDDAIYGAPDVVIEIISKNDSSRYQMHLETDYRYIGVSEIVFIDPGKSSVKYITSNDAGYETVTLTAGRLELGSIPGFGIDVEWLFAADRPDSLTTANQLVEAATRRSC
jgi:Uma2 family endonuclease